ncbi:hypothetical protein C8Q75DRAFT_757150 [Abortiporus biennis]|nr:hypothetical protein C8Q75DRAFT_757150 [Abortiporus biennis]
MITAEVPASPSFPSPSQSPSFSPLLSPSHDPALKPNPHPYAIKTTSTGVLTRSNSTSYNTNATRHYYIPTSPSSRSHPEHVSRHRHAKSNYEPISPSKAPRPLPVPPSFPTSNSHSNGYTSGEEPYMGPRRAKRAETLPSFLDPVHTHSTGSTTVTLDDLPSNPKLWSPSQLSSYLVTALRVSKSDDVESVSIPARVAQDIAAFIKQVRMNGRTFLRLNEEDLTRMGINQKWREALLIASRNLRQNVLKGRIWGQDESPDASPHPFSNSMYNSSSSSIGSANTDDNNSEPTKPVRRYRDGRVRGMVETFERSGSFSSESSCDEDELPTRPTFPKDWKSQSAENILQSGVFGPFARSPSPERRPLPEPPVFQPVREVTEEPSIEDLLASTDRQPGTWGARAWEQMDYQPGVTVKRLGDNGTGQNGNNSTVLAEELDGMTTVIGIGRGSGKGPGSGRRKKEEKRIVTAIFTPSRPDNLPVAVQDDPPAEQVEDAAEISVPVTAIPIHHIDVTTGTEDLEDMDGEIVPLEQALATELAETKALLEALKARLETVEQKVADLEETERQRVLEEEKRRQEKSTAHTQQETQSGKSNVEGDSPSILSQASSFLPSFMQSRPTEQPGRSTDPQSVSELPSYVLLVGIGVCAIVLRVVFKKVGGRNEIGWRT